MQTGVNLAQGKDAFSIEHRAVDANAFHRRTLGCLNEYGAARTSANGAGHELLERYLAGEIVPACELRDGLEHGSWAAGKNFRFLNLFRRQ